MNRTIAPPSATNMSPSMYIDVIWSTSRAVASQPVGRAGKPLPSLPGGYARICCSEGRRCTGCRGPGCGRAGTCRSPMMSSPQRVAPWTLTFVSVPLPASSAGRQRHSTFFSRGSAGPDRRPRGTAARPRSCRRPSCPTRTTAVAFLRLEVDPVDRLRRGVDDVRDAVGARPMIAPGRTGLRPRRA